MNLVNLFFAFLPIWSLIDTAPTINHIDKERQEMITDCTTIPLSDFDYNAYELNCGYEPQRLEPIE